jgi:hypothetical protein
MRSSYYGNHGFRAELPVNNFDQWQQKVNSLWRGQWIDLGTRMIVITLNVVNPNISQASVVKIVFEIDNAGNVAPSYRIRSFDVDSFDSTSIILQVFLQLLIITQYIITFRDLSVTPGELNYFAFRKMPEKLTEFEPIKATYDTWVKHD